MLYVGQMKLPDGGQGGDGLKSALVQAKGRKWRSMLGRMSRDDAFDGLKAGEE